MWKPQAELLKQTYEGQLANLSCYGCPEEVIWELEDMRDKVLSGCLGLASDFHFPLLPVLPRPYLDLCKTIFTAKHGRDLQIDESQYREDNSLDEPYYLIGVSLIKGTKYKKDQSAGLNFSEAISLAIFSGLSGPFYAHRSYYLTEAEREESFLEQWPNLGTWLNTNTGSTGPFHKNGRYPLIKAVGRIGRNGFL